MEKSPEVPEALKAHEELGGGGVPLVLIGNHDIQGYDADAFSGSDQVNAG